MITWLGLLRRAWAAWKLRRLKFRFCVDCNTPLTLEEKAFGDRCDECCEHYKEKEARIQNDIPNRTRIARQQIGGQWAQLQAPGLMNALGGMLGGIQQSRLAQQQQQQMTMEQQRRLMEQQMNQLNQYPPGTTADALLRQLFGKPPIK